MSYRNFERLLQKNGTTVYRVAKETGITASTFSDWKSGRSMPKAEKLKKIAAFFDVSLEELIDGSRATAPSGKQIPIIGEIRAGAPIITNETILGYEYADVDEREDFFYLKVNGDSMKNIGMVDGSLVLFRKQQYAENGDIVACLVGGDSATVKRFQKNQKNIYLIPENDDYDPIRLTTDDFEAGEARILGVALEVKIKL